jgi:Cellulase (glycosyl hydrolase family 5)
MFVRRCIAVCAAMMCGFSLSPCASVSYDSIYWAPPLDVVGTKIVNANGYAVQLKGFATMGAYPDVTKDQIVRFRSDWHITLLRLPLLTSDCNCPRSICWTIGNIAINAANNAYITAADSIIKWCRDNHIYVLLDGWHEGGQGNTTGNFASTVAAWRLMADRYKTQDHIIWEIFNEPHNVSWSAWVPMAQQLVDTIRARNPVSKAIVVGTANWDQEADVNTLKIAREKIIYSWHPYSNVYGSIGATTWETKFGYIMTSNVAPVMNTEWGFTSASDSANYGTQLIQYMVSKGMSWTGWCYSSDWGPAMLSSVNPEVKNPSGNLMYKAFHDTVPVVVAVGVKNLTGAAASENISICNSAIQFYCSETSPVTLSLYSLDGRLVRKVLDQTFAKGNHSIRWNVFGSGGMSVAPALYTVRLKIKDREYHALVNIAR